MHLKDMKSFAQLIKFDNVWVYLVVALLNTLILFMVSYKFFQTMQQCGYDAFEYKKWLKKKENAFLLRTAMTSMLSMFLFLAASVAFLFWKSPFESYIGFVFYIYFIAIYKHKDRQIKKKLPLMHTKRMVRQMCVCGVLFFVFSLVVTFACDAIFYPLRNNDIIAVRYFLICLTPMFVPYAVLLSCKIISPFERANNAKYVAKCTKKLDDTQGLIKIGITGSYGKTSVKNILTAMIEKKYKVLSTPKSYNTPLGICKSLQCLDDTYEVFVAEMGAKRKGDIKALCEIVKPDYAIMCGITNQHMETFGTMENLVETKYELIENMKGNYAVFSGESEQSVKMYYRCEKEKTLAGIGSKNEVYADDIKYSQQGSEFTLNINGEKINCKTKLLGSGNVENICLSAALAYKMGVSLKEISAAIENLEPTPHRMEVQITAAGVTVIDDAYNCNPVGVKVALDTLKLFDGNKIVVTPGMVEQGKDEDKLNYEFGKLLAQIADYVIPVGKYGAYKIRDALIDEGFNAQNVLPAKTLEDAKTILARIVKSGDTVLFENDLPDKFE